MDWKGETYEQWISRAQTEGIRRFALLPTQMDDGTVVWLERYWAVLCWSGRHWRKARTLEQAKMLR